MDGTVQSGPGVETRCNYRHRPPEGSGKMQFHTVDIKVPGRHLGHFRNGTLPFIVDVKSMAGKYGCFNLLSDTNRCDSLV